MIIYIFLKLMNLQKYIFLKVIISAHSAENSLRIYNRNVITLTKKRKNNCWLCQVFM